MASTSLGDLVWAEKYRPRTLDEMLGREQIVSKLKTFAATKSMPHLLFVGPPGTSKTTAALALVNDLYDGNPAGNHIELNASVAPETPVLVRENGQVKRTTFGEIAERHFHDDSSTYARPTDLEVLSVDKDYNVCFSPVSLISRHRVDMVAEIRYESGVVRTSLDHSVIVIDREGNLTPRSVAELKEGDSLITFRTQLDENQKVIDLQKYSPQHFLRGTARNPKVKESFDEFVLTDELSWLFGTYLAEGCINFRGGTSGQVIFGFGYPQEIAIVERAKRILAEDLGLECKAISSGSGFNRTKKSSMQLRVCSTQLARFFKHSFDAPNGRGVATQKRTPPFVFDTSLRNRHEFLKGYMGDGSGDWGELVRYSSRSEQNPIDIAWLGRISGLDTSCFDGEARIVWKLPSYSYIKTELIPAEPLVDLFTSISFVPESRYALRHQLYFKKSKRISRGAARELLKKASLKGLGAHRRRILRNLKKLVDSPLSAVPVRNIRLQRHGGYVFDFSVPGAQVFWGGTTPVLLHNSDERGIDVVRNRIKEFAKSIPMAATPFKVVILDESDSMCLHPETKVTTGVLGDLQTPSLNELRGTNGDGWFDIPSLNFETLNPENDRGRVVRSGKAELYEVALEDGRTIRASPEHPFFSIEKGRVDIKRTKELMPGVTVVADFSDRFPRCRNCGKVFYRQLQGGHRPDRFCSTECRSAYSAHSFGQASLDERRRVVLRVLRAYGGGGGQTAEYAAQEVDLRNPYVVQYESQERGHDVIMPWGRESEAPVEGTELRAHGAMGASGHGHPEVMHAKVKDVRHIGVHEVLNIRMEHNRNFFLANGVLTHNTDDAQQALRRTMERYSSTTRFILIANELYKIIEPIQSRCSLFRFGPLKDEIITQRLEYIAKKEGIRCEPEALRMVVERAAGDMRMAINLAQGIAAAQRRIDAKTSRDFLGLYGVDRADELIDLGLAGKLPEALDLLGEIIHESGVQPKDVVRKLHRRISNMDLAAEAKISLLTQLAEVEYRLMVGADPEIQLTLMLAKLSEVKGHS